MGILLLIVVVAIGFGVLYLKENAEVNRLCRGKNP